jgi:hypothetical protein
MKKNKTVYLQGTFKDYAGIERPYIFCAVSVIEEGWVVTENDNEDLIVKTLRIGLSVVHEVDLEKSTEELGKQIAYGKAMSSKACSVLYSNNSGLINTAVVEALLRQEEKHFLNNPGKYIAGYEKARINHNFYQLGGIEISKAISDKIDEIQEDYQRLEEISNKSRKL